MSATRICRCTQGFDSLASQLVPFRPRPPGSAHNWYGTLAEVDKASGKNNKKVSCSWYLQSLCMQSMEKYYYEHFIKHNLIECINTCHTQHFHGVLFKHVVTNFTKLRKTHHCLHNRLQAHKWFEVILQVLCAKVFCADVSCAFATKGRHREKSLRGPAPLPAKAFIFSLFQWAFSINFCQNSATKFDMKTTYSPRAGYGSERLFKTFFSFPGV